MAKNLSLVVTSGVCGGSGPFSRLDLVGKSTADAFLVGVGAGGGLAAGVGSASGLAGLPSSSSWKAIVYGKKL